MKFYKLNPDHSISVTSRVEEAFDNNRIIKKTQIGDLEVSTVFLGIDHSWVKDGPPILFETMIFPECNYQTRCETYDMALIMHEEAVTYARAQQHQTPSSV